jgi:RHS repeat-associated protein
MPQAQFAALVLGAGADAGAHACAAVDRRAGIRLRERDDRGATVPDSVSLNLRMKNGANYVDRGTWTWAGSDWTSGAVRRLTTHAGTTWGTGLYPYTVEVTNWYQGHRYSTTVADTMVVVNRTASPFHAGWWLSGLEELHVSSMLWVGGDGSTRRYRPVRTDVWKTDAYARPDSITRVGGMYHRHLPDGSRVVFDTIGRHVQTVNRLGHATDFEYRTPGSRVLRYLRLPTASGTRPFYEFHYTADSLLWKVTAPPLASQARETTIGYDAAIRRLTITDPDLQSVHFDNHPTAWLIEWRTDRRGTLTRYRYVNGAMLDARIYMAGGGTSSSDIVTTFIPAETRGFRGTPAVDPAVAYTRIDGPRPGAADTTLIWVNRWGAPTRIRDALGNETRVFREHATFPTLVTRTIAPNGYTQRAVYDHLARLTQAIGINSLGDGRNDTTAFQYTNAQWPLFVTWARSPEGEVTHTGFDAQGNRIWEQVGSSAVRRVHFGYNVHGLVETVRTQAAIGRGDQPQRLLYQNPLGNLSATITPRGYQTNYLGDAVGRDTLVDAPVHGSTRLRTVRRVDVMDRDTLGITFGDAAEGDLYVRTHYDAEGNPLSVTRWSTVDPASVGQVVSQWTYDRAGRALTETSERNRTVRHEYSPSHLARTITANWDTIRFVYDVLERPTHRIVPSRTYGAVTENISNVRTGATVTRTYPHPPFANGPSGSFLVPLDTIRLGYHPVTGLMVQADNRDARIRRSHYPNGLLRTDSTQLRTWAELSAGGNFWQHSYGIEYRYDRNGRRTAMQLPENIAPRHGTTAHRYDVQRYGYDPETGALSVIQNVLGLSYAFSYDFEGALTGVDHAGRFSRAFTYDADGRRLTRVVNAPFWTGGFNPSLNVLNDALTYYDNGRIWVADHPSAVELAQRSEFEYTQLGRVRYDNVKNLGSGGPAGPQRYEDFAWDALGNRVGSQSSAEAFPTIYEYNVGTSQMRFSGPPPNVSNTGQPYTWADYDAAGNQTWFTSFRGTMTMMGEIVSEHRRTSRSYYGADGQLRGSDGHTCETDGGDLPCKGAWELNNETAGAFEWYRYDALGRRVLVRTRRDHTCGNECSSEITRYVWDGDQILFEIRANGGEVLPQQLEDDQASGPRQGSVFYTHGPGIDAPLDLIRSGFTIGASPWTGLSLILPIENWRGTFIGGTDAYGVKLPCRNVQDCDVSFPGTQYTTFFLAAGSSSRMNWFGSLIEQKQDANGLLYMRNRYYNPHTGTFTQEDPIGIAGGLNLYGYAGGDPVNFHDPFGLCPERLRVNGRCPGNLSITQYNRLEAGARNDMRAAAGAMYLSMLEQGEVRLVAATGNGRDAGADLRLNVVLVTEEFFVGRTDGELAFLGLHEVGHLIQWNSGMLISAIGKGVRPNRREMDRMVRAPEHSPAHGALQDDANQFACSHATAPGSYTHYCQ